MKKKTKEEKKKKKNLAVLSCRKHFWPPSERVSVLDGVQTFVSVKPLNVLNKTSEMFSMFS